MTWIDNVLEWLWAAWPISALLVLVVFVCCAHGAAVLVSGQPFPNLNGNLKGVKYVGLLGCCLLGLAQVANHPIDVRSRKARKQLQYLISDWHMGDKRGVILWLEKSNERDWEDPSPPDYVDR